MKKDLSQVRENSFGWLVKILSQKIDRLMAKELQNFGLNLGHFAMLRMLSEKEGINQTELGKAVGVPGYATTRNLDTLEKMNLVQRRPDPKSRRAYLVFLTTKGKTIAKKLPPLVKRVNAIFLSTLAEEESRQLIQLLRKVLRSVNEVSN